MITTPRLPANSDADYEAISERSGPPGGFVEHRWDLSYGPPTRRRAERSHDPTGLHRPHRCDAHNIALFDLAVVPLRVAKEMLISRASGASGARHGQTRGPDGKPAPAT